MDRRSFLRGSAAVAGVTAGGLLLDAWTNDAAAQTLQDLLKTAPNAGKALFGSTEVSSPDLKALTLRSFRPPASPLKSAPVPFASV